MREGVKKLQKLIIKILFDFQTLKFDSKNKIDPISRITLNLLYIFLSIFHHYERILAFIAMFQQ